MLIKHCSYTSQLLPWNTSPNIVGRNRLLLRRRMIKTLLIMEVIFFIKYLASARHSWKQDFYICYPFNSHNNLPEVIILISYHLYLPKEETGKMKSNSNYLGGWKPGMFEFKNEWKQDGKVFFFFFFFKQ